jgi:hypothetical protein
MTGKQVEKYIMRDLGMTPRHDCYALADAITDMAKELDHDECELMYLLLENRPITALHTHSYGFHTANGREIINNLQHKYYEYESAS